MKWKPKDDTCGVPGRGYIKAADYNQQDEDNLLKRAKNRGIDPTQFMLGAGFVPVKGPQLEIQMDEPEEELTTVMVEPMKEEKTKRKRRTKAELAADQGEGEE